jgi:hypothetical protein
MGTFNRAVWGGVVCASEFDGVSGVVEKIDDGATACEFATLIEPDVFVFAIGGVEGEPAVEPLDRWRLGFEGAAVKFATEMVGNQDVTGLTVETLVAVVAPGVIGKLNYKTEVDRESLIALGSTTRVVGVVVSAASFGGEAGGTFVNVGGQSEFGNSGGTFVEFGDTPVIEVTEALVPEHAQGISVQMVDVQDGCVRIV